MAGASRGEEPYGHAWVWEGGSTVERGGNKCDGVGASVGIKRAWLMFLSTTPVFLSVLDFSCVELVVFSAFLDKFLMVTALNYAALIKNHDTVGVADS